MSTIIDKKGNFDPYCNKNDRAVPVKEQPCRYCRLDSSLLFLRFFLLVSHGNGIIQDLDPGLGGSN